MEHLEDRRRGNRPLRKMVGRHSSPLRRLVPFLQPGNRKSQVVLRPGKAFW